MYDVWVVGGAVGIFFWRVQVWKVTDISAAQLQLHWPLGRRGAIYVVG